MFTDSGIWFGFDCICLAWLHYNGSLLVVCGVKF